MIEKMLLARGKVNEGEIKEFAEYPMSGRELSKYNIIRNIAISVSVKDLEKDEKPVLEKELIETLNETEKKENFIVVCGIDEYIKRNLNGKFLAMWMLGYLDSIKHAYYYFPRKTFTLDKIYHEAIDLRRRWNNNEIAI